MSCCRYLGKRKPLAISKRIEKCPSTLLHSLSFPRIFEVAILKMLYHARTEIKDRRRFTCNSVHRAAATTKNGLKKWILIFYTHLRKSEPGNKFERNFATPCLHVTFTHSFFSVVYFKMECDKPLFLILVQGKPLNVITG